MQKIDYLKFDIGSDGEKLVYVQFSDFIPEKV